MIMTDALPGIKRFFARAALSPLDGQGASVRHRPHRVLGDVVNDLPDLVAQLAHAVLFVRMRSSRMCRRRAVRRVPR